MALHLWCGSGGDADADADDGDDGGDDDGDDDDGDVVSLHLCPSFVPILASLLNREETSNVCRERST